MRQVYLRFRVSRPSQARDEMFDSRSLTRGGSSTSDRSCGSTDRCIRVRTRVAN